MKLLASLAVAFTLAFGTMASADDFGDRDEVTVPLFVVEGCSSPGDDAAEILKDHNKAADYLLEGEKAQSFAKKTGAPEAMLPMISAIQMWLLPSGDAYMVAFYLNGCRAGAFSMPVSVVVDNVSVAKPFPFIAVLRLRGA